LCTWTPAQATRLTLTVAIEKALCSHPKIRDARAAVNVERHQRFVALGSLLPSASATISNAQTYNNSRSLFGRSVTETKGSSSSMSFNWLLYDFGGRAAQIEAATELVIAASAGQDIALQNAFASVVDAYFQMLTSESMAEVARASIANSERAVAAAKVRSELGAATAADLQFARVGLAQAELVAARINEQLELSKGDLAASLHLDPGMPIKLASKAAERELGAAQCCEQRASGQRGRGNRVGWMC
jgi:outer membrane protein